MKKTLFLMLILLTTLANAEEQNKNITYTVACYSGGKEIFKGTTNDLMYLEDGYIKFVDNASKKLTQIKGNCIITENQKR